MSVIIVHIISVLVILFLNEVITTNAQECDTLPSDSLLEVNLQALLISEAGESPDINPNLLTVIYTCMSMGSYREVSVIVTYDNVNNAQASQFDLECVPAGGISGWQGIGGSLDVAPAGFETLETRTNCSQCRTFANNDYDCVACHPDCNTGLMRCTGTGSDDCCPLFDNGQCAEMCSQVNFAANEQNNFTCSCALTCGPGYAPDPNCSICVLINICEAEIPCDNNEVCILGSQPDEFSCDCTNNGTNCDEHVPLPVVSIFPRTVHVPVISTVILTCKVQSLTTPNVTWTSSADVTLSSTLLLTSEDIHYSTITLEKVTLEYIGEYACTAENEGGEISDMINVDVYVPLPVVTIFPRSVVVPVSSTVILTCEIHSLTTPNITWTSNTDVTLSSTLPRSNGNIHCSDVTLENVTLDYTGEYTCTAENEGGEISNMINVNVYVPLPVVTISPGSVDVTVFSTVILTCEVQSLTTPNVTWTSSTDVNLSSTSLVSNENIHNSTLTLEQVTLEYIGEYTCTAENEGGEISDTINVNVYETRGVTEDTVNGSTVIITTVTIILVMLLIVVIILLITLKRWRNRVNSRHIEMNFRNAPKRYAKETSFIENKVSDNDSSLLINRPPFDVTEIDTQVAYIEGRSNAADIEHLNSLNYEIHSDLDPQRVSTASCNNTDDIELPLDVEAPEEYEKYNMCSFDEMLEMPFDENGLFYHSYKYGVTIIIPPGAVLQPCTLQFGACLLLPHFRSSDSFIPVSPFVWIHIDSLLAKPAELYIPHYVDVSNDENKKTLCLLTTKENCEVFTADKVAQVSFSPTLARIFTTNFCSLCVAAKDPPRKRYYLLYAEKELEDGSLYVDICIMYFIKCLQKVKEQLKEYKENKILHRGPVSFGDDSNGISVTFDPNHVPGWIIDFRDIHCEKITEDMIDIYEVLGCTPETVTDNDIEDLKMYEEADSYPPRFKVQFSPNDSQSRNTQVTLSVHGLRNKFSRTIRLGKENPGSLPTSRISFSSDTSGYESGNAGSPTALFHEVDSPSSQSSDTFIVDLMNFLESKLRSKWYQLGHHLKLPMEELHRIEINVGQDSERCTRQILFMWRRLNPAATWEPIAEALELSGLSLLSAIVTKRYTNPGPIFCQICQCTHGLDYTEFVIHDLLTSIPNNFLLQSAPDISKLSDLVGAEIPAKWELFGVQVGLEQSYLDCLRDEHHDSKIRFIHLFNEWKTMKTSDFTWATVIKVLYSKTISEYTLAENVLKKLKSSATDFSQQTF